MLFLDEISSPLHVFCGIMYKMGGMRKNTRQKRFFILSNVNGVLVLNWRSSADVASPLGAATVREARSNRQSKTIVLLLDHSAKGRCRRTVLCENENDFYAWTRALRATLA